MAIAFEGKAVIASVKKGATAVWLGISLEQHGDGLRLVKRAFTLEDDDHDGVVRVELPRDVPERSFWMIVDLKSGEYGVSAPNGGALLTRKAVPADLLRSRSEGAAARLLHAYPLFTALLVRPGVGAWIAHVRDGYAEDGDGQTDGKAAALLEHMIPIGSSPAPPDDLAKDDVVALVDPLTLSILDGRVVK